MTIFIREDIIFWFEIVNCNISEYASYLYFFNSWVYDMYIEPYSIYKTGAFRRYYLRLGKELFYIKGKTTLVIMGNSRFFYYHKGTRLRGLPIIKFWYFYKNMPYYYYLSEAKMNYVSDFELYDKMQ